MFLRRVLGHVKAVHASTKRTKAGLQGSQDRQTKPYLRMRTMHLGLQMSSESEQEHIGNDGEIVLAPVCRIWNCDELGFFDELGASTARIVRQASSENDLVALGWMPNHYERSV